MPEELTLFADYRQIHLFEEGSDDDLDDDITEDALADGLVVGREALFICTEVNVDVVVRVEVSERPPVDDSADFDHVVEGSLYGTSGRLVLMGCTDYEPEATRIDVPAGWLRVRAARSNLAVARRLDVHSSDDPATMERVRIQIWPAEPRETTVLKRWSGQD